MGGRRNAKGGGRTLTARGMRSLDGATKRGKLGVAGVVSAGSGRGSDSCGIGVRRAGFAVLLAGLDDLALAFSHVKAALELLAHGRVLRVEARREAGKAHVVELATGGARGAGCEGAGGMNNVVVGGQVQALGAMAGGGGHVGRGRLFLNNDGGRGVGKGRALGVCASGCALGRRGGRGTFEGQLGGGEGRQGGLVGGGGSGGGGVRSSRSRRGRG